MTSDSLKTLSLRRSYMKKKSSSSKKNQKKNTIYSNKTKKASKKNSLMTYYSNLSNIYKNTIQSKFLQRFLKHSSEINSKYPYMEITACIFAQFNPVNLKLVNAISEKPSIFFKKSKLTFLRLNLFFCIIETKSKQRQSPKISFVMLF
jgi:hypothetical protein